MKQMLNKTAIVFVYLILNGCSPGKEEISYISFEKDCIEQKGPISRVVERTLEEFPECRISNKGKFMETDYIYVRCGNTPLLHNNFIATGNRKACQAFSEMDSYQKKQVFLENRQ